MLVTNIANIILETVFWQQVWYVGFLNWKSYQHKEKKVRAKWFCYKPRINAPLCATLFLNKRISRCVDPCCQQYSIDQWTLLYPLFKINYHNHTKNLQNILRLWQIRIVISSWYGDLNIIKYIYHYLLIILCDFLSS